MKLVAFRINNFKSIIDTGWRDLSTDNITGLIGQNESGKSSVLQALHSFYDGVLEEDYLRGDESLPKVSCSFEVDHDQLESIFSEYKLPDGLVDFVKRANNRVNFVRIWTDVEKSTLYLEQDKLGEIFNKEPEPKPETADEEPSDDGSSEDTTEAVGEQEPATPEMPLLGGRQFINGLYDELPVFELFEDNASLLPATIDLAEIDKKNSKVAGIKGAKNFLTIIGLSPADFASGNERIIGGKIRNANMKLTKEFQKFWSQYVGNGNKIEIELELKHHDASSEALAGQPYLSFWVKDRGELLRPAQRSQGVQWFLSFFLQLKASAMIEEKGQVLLIDEPGARLHAKAQEDVLKVFEDIKDELQIIYTTHSPYLIDSDSFYRLLAVQRSVEDDTNSETQVLGVHHLGAASEDTLLPVYTLIGVNLQHQKVIKAKNNVIIEEPSAFYYLRAFKQMVNETHEINFIPSSGVTKIPVLVNLFLGWGLDFVVLTDDDPAGKKVRRGLKADIYGGDAVESSKHLLGIKDCDGIEDIFTKGNFKDFVIHDSKASYTVTNSAYINSSHESKVLTAVKFFKSVEDGTLTLDMFSAKSQDNIKKLIQEIVSKLK